MKTIAKYLVLLVIIFTGCKKHDSKPAGQDPDDPNNKILVTDFTLDQDTVYLRDDSVCITATNTSKNAVSWQWLKGTYETLNKDNENTVTSYDYLKGADEFVSQTREIILRAKGANGNTADQIKSYTIIDDRIKVTIRAVGLFDNTSTFVSASLFSSDGKGWYIEYYGVAKGENTYVLKIPWYLINQPVHINVVFRQQAGDYARTYTPSFTLTKSNVDIVYTPDAQTHTSKITVDGVIVYQQ